MNEYTRIPEGTQRINLGGLGVVFRLFGPDTQNTFSVVEHPLKPHTLAAPIHTHSHEDEFSYILEGKVMVMIGDEVFTAGPGMWVIKPRGIPHSFWNAESEPVHILEIISPPGFEAYFKEMAIVAASQPPDFGRTVEIQMKYGLVSDPDSIQFLCQKYHLTLDGST